MRKNHKFLFESLHDACDVSDAACLVYQQYIKNKKVSDMLISGEIQFVPFSDNFLYEDNDGDGIPNKDDPYPDEPFDDKFMIVGDYNYYPEIDFMDIEKYGTGSTEFKFDEDNSMYYGIQGEDGRTLCYNRNEITPYDNSMYCILSIADAVAYMPILDLIVEKASVNKFVSMPWAASLLSEFLSGNCKKYELYDNEMKSIITSHPNNLYHYMLNINALMNISEHSLKDGSTLICSSKTDDVFKIACYTDKQKNVRLIFLIKIIKMLKCLM